MTKLARRFWFWRPSNAKLWHIEEVNNRTVCGLRVVGPVKDGAVMQVVAFEAPGKLCANCKRMKDAESVAPMLRKE